MRRTNMMLLVVALVAGMTTAAGAQAWSPQRGYGYHDQDRDHDRDHDRDNDKDKDWYNRGFQQGQYDMAHHARSRFPGHGGRPQQDAWQRGYDEGYRQGQRDGRGPEVHYPNNGTTGYPNGGYGGVTGTARQAREIGYNDGVSDGRNDRATGHSFRPTHDDNYKNADRGYNSSYGDKQTYKNTYRQGYEEGYNRGYNNR